MALSAEQEAKKKALETAYKSLPKEEALKAHPELAGVYKMEAAAQEFAVKHIGHSESQKQFIKEVQQKSFRELAKGNSLPDLAKQQQTPQPSVKDLDIER